MNSILKSTYIKLIFCSLLLAIMLLFAMATSVFASQSKDMTHVTIKSFKNAGVSSVTIGSDVRSISGDAFNNLHGLSNISVSEDNKYYSSYGNCLYNKEKTELLCFPQGLASTSFPDTMVKVNPNALKGKSSTFKASVKQIAKNNSQRIESEGSGQETTDIEAAKQDELVEPDSSQTQLVVPDSEFGRLLADRITICIRKGMTREDILRSCYEYVIDFGKYKRFNSMYTNGWVESYADEFLSTGLGNCSSYAATFACMARGLGYDSRVATGVVGAAGGGTTEHAWTEVNIGGNWYIFDSELEDAKGKDYYMKTYNTYPSSGLSKLNEWYTSW